MLLWRTSIVVLIKSIFIIVSLPRGVFLNPIRADQCLNYISSMGGKRKINLQIDCEEVTEMEKSIFSEIGNDGLRFLRHGLHIGPEGTMTITGEVIPSLLPTTKTSLSVSEELGRGAACVVEKGLYRPLDIPVAIKVRVG